MKVAYILALSSMMIVFAACIPVLQNSKLEADNKRREDIIDGYNGAAGGLAIASGFMAASPVAPLAVIPAVGAGAMGLAAVATKHEVYLDQKLRGFFTAIGDCTFFKCLF